MRVVPARHRGDRRSAASSGDVRVHWHAASLRSPRQTTDRARLPAVAQQLIFDFVAELAAHASSSPSRSSSSARCRSSPASPTICAAVRAAATSSAPTCGPARASTGSRTCGRSPSPTASVGHRAVPGHARALRRPAGRRAGSCTACVADGGVCVLSSVMFFPVHGYPHDYWRFTPEGMRLLLEPFDDVWVARRRPPRAADAGGRRWRPRARHGSASDGARAVARPRPSAQWDRAEGKVRVGLLHVPLAELARTLAAELPRAVAQRAAGAAQAAGLDRREHVLEDEERRQRRAREPPSLALRCASRPGAGGSAARRQ